MRILSFHPASASTILILCVGLFLSACSSNSDVKSISKKQQEDKKTTVKSVLKKEIKGIKHSHPSNPCSTALDHLHVFENIEHKHNYDCENTNEFVNNAHIHPAIKQFKRTRHVHQNGSKKHSHHR